MGKLYMKTVVIVMFLALSVTLRASAPVLVHYKELNARAGLPNFFYKLNQSESVKIAYFGGSITYEDSGWRDQTMEWFKAKYPKCDFQQKNAALPGTGSDFGAFRVDKDIISFNPDLVFIEFAVNDNGKEASEISKSMEGIVRKIRKALPTCEICFVYTICQDMAPTLVAGMLPISASTMERLADYYGIPSIFMGVEILKFAKEDELVWKGKIEEQPGKFVFASDGVHPLRQTGHKLYSEAVSRSMLKLETISKLQKHSLPKPLNKENYEQATMIPVSELIKKDVNWEYLQKGDAVFDRFSHLLPELAKSRNANAIIQVKFNGSKIGLLDIMGPSSCFINVTVNNSDPKLYKRFDQSCTWCRINYFTVDEIKKQGIYSVTFEVSDEHFNKKEILLENAENKDIELNDEYKSYDYYTGYIMLIGKIVPN